MSAPSPEPVADTGQPPAYQTWLIAGGLALALTMGMASWGLAQAGLRTGLGMMGAAVAGAGAAVAWGGGRWDSRDFGPSRALLAMLATALGVMVLQLIPWPAAWLAAVSPVHRAVIESWRAVGLEPPTRLAISLAPEAGWQAVHRLVAMMAVLAGAATLAHRRSGARALVVLVAGFAMIEGIVGLVRYVVANEFRGAGLLYNPNHHAAAVAAGLPLALAGIVQWSRNSTRFREALLGGRNPLLVLFVPALIAAAGWLVAFSRGSMLAVCLVVPVWLAVEWSGRGRGRWLRAGGLALLMAALVLGGAALLSRAYVDRLLGSPDLGALSRVATWQAVLAGWREVPLLGLGPGGAEFAINRHSTVPLVRVPIHAHNDWLEWAACLGLLGGALVAAMAAWFVKTWRVRERHRRFDPAGPEGMLRRAALAGLAILLLHATVDFHLRIPAVGFLAMMLAALALHRGSLTLGGAAAAGAGVAR